MSDLKETYRGHEIELSQEECMGGWEMIYFSIYTPDGTEVCCNFTEEEITLPDFMVSMRERVDEELASDDPWDLKAEGCEQ